MTGPGGHAPSPATGPGASPAVPATGRRTSRPMRWWGRLLLVLAAEAMLLLGYAWQARPEVFEQPSPPWIVYVFCAFLLVVVIQGSARFPAGVHGAVWLASIVAAVTGVWGAVPAYVGTVGQERTVTVESAVRDSSSVTHRTTGSSRHRTTTSVYSVAEVRVDGGSGTRQAYLRGDWEQRVGATTTVREDPLGIAGLQAATPMSGLRVFWFVLWIPAFLVLQLGLLAVLLRRGPSLVSRVPDAPPP